MYWCQTLLSWLEVAQERRHGKERCDVKECFYLQVPGFCSLWRALGQISERLGVQVSDVKNVIIWGNHSSTQYPDVNHAIVGDKPVRELVADDAWLNDEFITTVQQRAAAIIKARKLSSALFAASSACDHIHDWVLRTPEGTFVSMGVYSDGSYNVPAGLIYSFPVTCKNREWSIVQGNWQDGAAAVCVCLLGSKVMKNSIGK